MAPPFTGVPFSQTAGGTYFLTVNGTFSTLTLVATAFDPLARINFSTPFGRVVMQTSPFTALNEPLFSTHLSVTTFNFSVQSQDPSIRAFYSVLVTKQLSTITTLASVVCPGFVVTGTYGTAVSAFNSSITCTATTSFPGATVRFLTNSFGTSPALRLPASLSAVVS